ncbi:hypothetical protein V7149_12355 [Bacillus sp. JJ1503]
MYFKRALDELAIKKPSFEICACAYIGLLANKIIKANDHKEIFNLAYMIFQVVAIEIDYSDDLYGWFEISELIDRLDYDDKSFVLNEEDVILMIKNEAENLLRLNH